MTGNLLKCSHKKLVLPMINFDFSKKSSGQINVRFFFKSNKNGRKKPDIYLTGPGMFRHKENFLETRKVKKFIKVAHLRMFL